MKIPFGRTFRSTEMVDKSLIVNVSTAALSMVNWEQCSSANMTLNHQHSNIVGKTRILPQLRLEMPYLRWTPALYNL